MEPASTSPDVEATLRHNGHSGTLANPEVHEDVPGHVIPILEREFDDFDTEAGRFLRFYEEGLHGYTYLEEPHEK